MKVTSTLSSTRFGNKLISLPCSGPAQLLASGGSIRLIAERFTDYLMQLAWYWLSPVRSAALRSVRPGETVTDRTSFFLPVQSLKTDQQTDPPDDPPVACLPYIVPTTTVPHAMNELSLLKRFLPDQCQWYGKRPAPNRRRATAMSMNRAVRLDAPELACSGKMPLRSAVRFQPMAALFILALTLVAALSGSASAVAQSINLSVRQIAEPKRPAINTPVNYTIIVKNSGADAATGITLRDSLPVGGTTFGSLDVLRGSGVTHTTPADFTDITIPALAPNDSVVLKLNLIVHEQGVWFNNVEVTAATGTDMNSVPGNHSLLEDDSDATCFAIPLTWYSGDQFLVSIPSGYAGIKWYRNGTQLTAPTDSAVVNSDGTLTIKGPGAYSFSTTRNGCTTGNCCNIDVVPGGLARLGNFVFEDKNVNGVQDSGEPGIASATVTLLLNGTPVKTVSTDANGLYSFDGLTPGNANSYIVQFGTPTGYTATAANVGNTATDSDASLATGRSGSYTLTAGEYNQTVDAGFYKSATIGDYVFVDTNRNGVQDGTDTPMASVTVTLYQNGNAVATTVTGVNGLYTFVDVTPGSSNSYVVGFTTPTSYSLTTPLAGTDKTIDSDVLVSGLTTSLTLASGETNTSIDAGFTPLTASLGDYVFEDVNLNGTQDGDDKPISGLVVTLLQGNTVVATTNTNQSGFYSFNNLQVGVPYSVSFTAPSGYTATLANVGDDNSDSDAGTNGLTTQPYILTASQFNQSVDAGFYKTATLGNYVFADNNKNGIQDGTDTPMASVTVTLYQNGNAVATTVTGVDGLYSFPNLTPGSSNSYAVGFSTPANYSLTTPLAGGDRAADSDVLASGLTASLTLASGETNNSIDAGFTPLTAGLGNYVFGDLNHNGIQDEGDKPISGVVVTLLQGSTVVASTTTNLSGLYSFTGLQLGVPYSVSFTAPAGLTATLANAGTDDAVDSDGDLVTGLTSQTFSLTANEFNQTIDMGYIGLASLGSYVFADNNKDGVQDTGDAPIGGVTVTLYQNGTAVATTVTDPAGLYIFTGLTPGSSNTYTIGFSTPANYSVTTPLSGTDKTKDSDLNPVTGRTTSLTLSSGEVNTTVDAGFVLPSLSDGKIGNFVWYDYNGDGRQGPTTGANAEPGVPGVSVQLYSASTNTLLRTTTTGTDGSYVFDALDSGTYYVKFTVPTGSVLTTVTAPGVPVEQNSDAGKDGKTGIITIDISQPVSSTLHTNLTVDAGVTPFGSIGDLVFLDTNGDGIQNDGNTGVSGVTVQLYDVLTGLKLDEVITNNVGTYQFDSLKAGTYQVKFVLPAGKTFTSVGQGTSATDSDANITTGLSGTITIDVKQPETSLARNNPTIDAGISGTCTTPVDLIVSANLATTTICAGGKATITATTTVSGATIQWFLSAAGGQSFTTTQSGQTLSVEPTATTTYYAQATSPAGCKSALKSVVITVPKPATPTVVSQLANVCPKTTADLTTVHATNTLLPGSVTEFHTTALATSPIVANQTAVTAGTYYLFEKTKEGCYSSPATVTVTIVDACLTDLAITKQVITPGPFHTGQQVTYSITVKNEGAIPAKSVTVSETLPAGLTYVSTTPSGEYSAATGIWTIGQLNAGASRTLLIETTLTGSGMVKNVAVVRSPDNDPGKTQNDTSQAAISTEACSLLPPRVYCAITEICKGEFTTLTARDCDGTIVWSDGQTGGIVNVRPLITTTYNASCVTTTCSSGKSKEITITVLDLKQPTILASSPTICPGGSVTLTVTGCETGKPVWSEGQQGVTSIVVQPTSKTTYTVQCRVNSCLSVPAEKTIDIGTDLPKPTVVCSTTVVCPGESVTLEAKNCIGTPLWNTQETTGSITVFPTATNNTFYVVCSSGNCISPKSDNYVIRIVTPAVPTVVASADTICVGGTVTLTAFGCEGSVIWSNGVTQATSITVSPSATQNYYAQCKVRSCLSDRSKPMTIAVVSPTVPTVSVKPAKPLFCAGESVTLTAANCNGTVRWSNNATGSTLTFMAVESGDYYAYCTLGSCKSANSNTIRVNVGTTGTAPTVTASALTVCNGASVTLTAANCAGTILWSDNQTGQSVTVLPTVQANEFYAVCKPTSGTACGSPKSSTVKITVTTPGVPTVTCSTTVICPGESVNLVAGNCVGTPMWSTGATTPTIDVKPTVTTGYTVFCKDGACVSPTSATYTIMVVPVVAPTVAVSSTNVTAGQSVTLTATGCPGVVSWSNSLTGSTIVIKPTATMTLYAQCKFRTCLSDPSVSVKVNVPGSCLAKAGSLTTDTPLITAQKGKVATITAKDAGGRFVPAGYTVLYALTKGADLVVQQLSSAASFTITADTTALYTIHTLVYDSNKADKDYLDLSTVQLGKTKGSDILNTIASTKVCADLDVTGAQVKVKYLPAPVIATNTYTVCYGGTVSLTATGCNGVVTWFNQYTGKVLNLKLYETTWQRATCTENGVTSDFSNMIDVEVVNPTVPTVASNRLTVCAGETATLTAVGCDKGVIQWSTGATGNSITVTPTTALNEFKAKCAIGECVSDFSLPAKVNVTVPVIPTISIAGSATGVTSTTTCNGVPITLTAAGCQSGLTVLWSNNQTGTSITVTPTASTTYTAQCFSTTSCIGSASKPVSVVVTPTVAQPQTADRANTCPFKTVDLTKGVSSTLTAGSVYEYYTDAALTTKVASPTAVLTSGTYYVVEKSAAGCYSLPGIIHVQITTCDQQVACAQNPITVNAGIDATVCAAKDYKLSGQTTGTVASVYWTTSGTGTFNDPFSPTATYTASLKDVQTGVVSLTLTAKSNNATCPAVSDAMSLTVTGIKTVPVAKVIGATSFCFGDSVTLQADAGYTYKWSTKATTQKIVVKTSGTYTVTLFDANGCSSVPSEPVTIVVNEPAPTPVVANIRNICPETTVDLNRAIVGTTAAGTTYEFRLGALPAGGLISGHVVNGPGTVYVYAKTAQGCYSLPGIVTVSVFNCKGDTLKADVSIAKTADRTIVKPGTPVKYTIRVKNNGPAIARRIDIRDVLPTGLSLVPGATNFKLSNGIITRRFDSLAVGQSDSITFLANVTIKGPIVNKALITYTDLLDPIAKNDTSSVTVRDTSSAVGLPVATGLAKNLVSAKFTSDTTFDATYAFYVRNYGSTTLTNVKITDNLSRVFATHTIQKVTVTTETGSTLKPSSTFTGTGTAIQLLDSTNSTLAAGANQSVQLTVSVRVNKADTTRSFANTALVTALNSGTLLQDNSVAGANPDPDNDGNPNNNSGATVFRLQAASAPQLGVALAVVRAVKQPDNSYNVTYKVTVKNYSTVKLTNVSLLDSLSNTFKAPVTYTVVSPPKVGPGSGLVPVSEYNGSTVPYFLFSGGSTLAAGATDSLTFIVNVKPGATVGPFYSSVYASAKPESSTVVVRDLSNNGFDPTPAGAVPTPVSFNLPVALVGVAKSVGTPTRVEDGVYDIPYTIRVANAGSVALKNVQVIDNLNKTFGHGALIVSNVIAVTADAGLTVNPGYSGQGLLTSMLKDSLSTLPVGASRSLSFTVRVNVKNADSLRFYNSAIALATPVDGSLAVRDTSTSGINPDPDNDLDPRNNSTPTAITLNGVPGDPHLGLALSIRDTVRQQNGTYNVTYRVVVRNYGTQALANVLLTDTLSKVFSPLTGASYTMVGTPKASAGSQLKLNPLFNGVGDTRLTLADSSSKLAVGKVDTLLITINVSTTGKTSTFLNTVYGAAKSGTVVVTDLSTNGLNPDLNGNGNPSDTNESQPTPLVLTVTPLADLFIPEGFSPNNDGINDYFVIQGTQGLTVHLEVFNRWGHVVYKSDDYKNDWNGTSNTGVLNGDAQGLPEGTYFYLVRLSDGREFVRYMTINR